MIRETVTIRIEKLVQGGDGLGRMEGKVVFIPYTLPGETVEARVHRREKDYAEAELLGIKTPSPERRPPACPVFGVCGGCQLQHLSEAAQVRHKTEALRESLGRIGRLPGFDLLPAVEAPAPYHYRTRAQLKVKRGGIGFYRRKSHRLVPVERCPLLMEPLNAALALIKKELPLAGLWEIELHGTSSGPEVLVILRGEAVSRQAIDDFYRTAVNASSSGVRVRGVIAVMDGGRRVLGQDYLDHAVLGKKVRVSDRSFSQVNGPVNERLIETAMEWMDPGPEDRVLELFSGAGNFTLFLAGRAGSVTAVEENEAAVEDARWNLGRAGLDGVRLVRASAEETVREALRGKESYTQVFLDPPREGASPALLDGLIALSVPKIFYLSCHPAGLARDLRRLSEHGYRAGRIQPFEMFPQTGHLEILAEAVKASAS